MKNRTFILFWGLLAFCALGMAPSQVDLGKNLSKSKPVPDQIKINEQYGRLPLAFEPNRGQFDPQVKFLCRGRGYSLFITQAEAVLVLKNDHKQIRSEELGIRNFKNSSFLIPNSEFLNRESAVVRLRLVGGNRLCHTEGLEKLPGISNYFIGNDPSKWRTNIPQYTKAKLKDVYPGIDMVYYGNPFDGAQGGGHGQLEYDFVVKPGADPKAIALKVDGADKIQVDKAGNLQLVIGKQKLVFKAPIIYQIEQGERKPIEGRYVKASGKEIGFEVKDYDQTNSLVIDPTLEYSTYLGGNNIDYGQEIAVDLFGNAYVTGWTNSTNFPTTAGVYQTSNGGGVNDAFVTKLNAAGTALVYSTFLGGNNLDNGNGIAVDSGGCAYVTGETDSANFPTTPGVFQNTLAGGANAFATKLNAAGTALVYSTYLGGNYDYGYGIAVDSGGNAYVTGCTRSINFPVTAGAYQTTLGGNFDVFITKLNSTGTALAYSTYLGGSERDQGFGIALDTSGNSYVVGFVESTNFPITTGAYQTSFGGGTWDAFVTKLNAAGTALVYSTYLGGSFDEWGYGIALNSSGNAYVTGFTRSVNFPNTAGAFQTSFGGGYSDAFVTQLNATGTTLVYSTYLGGSGVEYGRGIAIDTSGNAYVAGYSDSGNFPTTSDAYQTGAGGANVFFTKLNISGSAMVYSTLLGGDDSEMCYGIALDTSGNAYVTGWTDSTDFPFTAGVYQTTLRGTQNAFVAKFGFESTAATLTPTDTSTRTPTATPTLSPTPFITPTSTNTSTITSTSTITYTPTVTWTITSTSTPTASTTPTATSSPSFTPTYTPSASPTPTTTYTPTLSQTPTVSPTSTITSSVTPTPTPTIQPGLEVFYVSKNQFNPDQESVSIFVATSKYGGHYSLTVYNSAGECVKVLDKEELIEPFQHSYLWDGTNQYGEKCASGVYIFYLTEPFGTRLARVLLVR